MEGKCVYGEPKGRAATGGIIKQCACKVSITMPCFRTTNPEIDFVNTQPLTNPQIYLGDGLSGHLELGGRVGHP